MDKILWMTLFVMLSHSFQSQAGQEQLAVIKGCVILSSDLKGVANLRILIPGQKVLTTTNDSGTFLLEQVRYGRYALVIMDGFGWEDSILIIVDKPFVTVDTLKINLERREEEDAINFSVAILTTQVNTEDAVDAMIEQQAGKVLNTNDNATLLAATASFATFRYQVRGYNNNQLTVLVNGIPMNDMGNGNTLFNQWGGLNDMFRNQKTTFGLQYSEQGTGGLLGMTSINTNAFIQPKKLKVSYVLTNGIYRNAFSLSYNSGMMKNAWAFSLAFSKRWSEEGYVPGTFFNGYSYYFGLSKKLRINSVLHFSAFAAPHKKGNTIATTLEAMDLATDHFYNPNWGYQNAEKRNARISSSFLPVAILRYDLTPNSATTLAFATAYQFGTTGSSALDWYNAQDPRPDYYKNLPGYYEHDINTASPEKAALLRTKWANDETVRQVNWNRMYEANSLSYDSINGATGKRSVYMVGEDKCLVQKFSFSTSLIKKIQEYGTLSTGLFFINQKTIFFREMIDLLGGDYYVNLNQFAEKTYVGNTALNQNDLNRPNGIVKKGDKYGYHYKATYQKASVWGQFSYHRNRVKIFFAGRVMQDVFSRKGLYRNGLFSDDSYGASSRPVFFTYQFKAGASHAIVKKHRFFFNTVIMTTAPTFENTFISPKTRNKIVGNPTPEKIKSIEAGYVLRKSFFDLSVSGFASSISNGTDIMRFYHEDYRTFVNYVMRDIAVRYTGGELAFHVKLTTSFSADFVATWTQAFYNSNPVISIYSDNDTSKNVGASISYLKNVYLAAGPQSAYHCRFNYADKKYGQIGMNLNYLTRSFTAVNPTRRTSEAVALQVMGSNKWHEIVDQERLPAAFTMDLFIGKSFTYKKPIRPFSKRLSLYINLGITNILNNKNIRIAGSEQLRFDTKTADPERFPSKYYYGYGRSYFAGIGIRL